MRDQMSDQVERQGGMGLSGSSGMCRVGGNGSLRSETGRHSGLPDGMTSQCSRSLFLGRSSAAPTVARGRILAAALTARLDLCSLIPRKTSNIRPAKMKRR